MILPAVGVSSKLIHLNKVDFHDPEAPIRDLTYPLLTVKSISLSTTLLPKLLLKCFMSIILSDMVINPPSS